MLTNLCRFNMGLIWKGKKYVDIECQSTLYFLFQFGIFSHMVNCYLELIGIFVVTNAHSVFKSQLHDSIGRQLSSELTHFDQSLKLFRFLYDTIFHQITWLIFIFISTQNKTEILIYFFHLLLNS